MICMTMHIRTHIIYTYSYLCMFTYMHILCTCTYVHAYICIHTCVAIVIRMYAYTQQGTKCWIIDKVYYTGRMEKLCKLRKTKSFVIPIAAPLYTDILALLYCPLVMWINFLWWHNCSKTAEVRFLYMAVV